MTVPTILTKRLALRQMQMSDVAQVVSGLNNLNVSRWLTVVPYPYCLADAEWFITENIEGRFTSWSIWADDAIIGNVGLGPTLGYWLAEPAWGKGYGYEAASAICDHHFESTDAESLQSEFFVGNAGSETILHKLGLLPTGQQTSPIAALGTTTQSTTMELTRNRWETLRTGAQ